MTPMRLLLVLVLTQEPLPDGAAARVGLAVVGRTSPITALAWSPDSRRLAAGGRAHSFRVWDARTWKAVGAWVALESPVHALAFSPDGLLLASGHGRDPENDSIEVAGPKDLVVRLWDLATEKEALRLDGHRSNVRALAFSPAGSTLASGDVHGGLRIWNLPAGTLRASATAQGGVIHALRMSPDGLRLASAASWAYPGGMCASEVRKPPVRASLQVWDPATGANLLTLPQKQEELGGLGYAASLASFAGGEVRTWDAQTGELLRSTRFEGFGPAAFSSDGARVAVAVSVGVQVGDTATGRTLRVFRTDAGPVAALGFSPDGLRLASGHADATTIVWDLSGLK